jgi:hypothetical protein
MNDNFHIDPQNGLTLLPPHETSLKYMLRLAAPMIVTNISFTVMQFVDRFMVSRLGTEALAAILPAGFPARQLCNRRDDQRQHLRQSKSRPGQQERLLGILLAGDIYGPGIFCGRAHDYVAFGAADIPTTWTRAGRRG